MSYMNLITKEQRKILEQDAKGLEKYTYLVECETCQEIFHKEPFSTVRERLVKKEWMTLQPWFFKACRHWLAYNFKHKIWVCTVDPQGHKTRDFCISDKLNTNRISSRVTTPDLIKALASLEQKTLAASSSVPSAVHKQS